MTPSGAVAFLVTCNYSLIKFADKCDSAFTIASERVLESIFLSAVHTAVHQWDIDKSHLAVN